MRKLPIKLTLFVLISLAILVTFTVVPGSAASNYVRVHLGKGASIEVPRNWTVMSNNQRMTIDAFVEAKGMRLTESTFEFAANLYNEQGKTIALINARFYPENTLTQIDARQIKPAEIAAVEAELRSSTERSLATMNARILVWRGSKIRVINGLHVYVHEHLRSGIKDLGATTVRGLRVWRSPRSFTVTLSYVEREAMILSPIIDYMTNSLRQD